MGNYGAPRGNEKCRRPQEFPIFNFQCSIKKTPPLWSRGDVKSRYHPNSSPAGTSRPGHPGRRRKWLADLPPRACTVPLSLQASESAWFPQCLCISSVFYHKRGKSQYIFPFNFPQFAGWEHTRRVRRCPGPRGAPPALPPRAAWASFLPGR